MTTTTIVNSHCSTNDLLIKIDLIYEGLIRLTRTQIGYVPSINYNNCCCCCYITANVQIVSPPMTDRWTEMIMMLTRGTPMIQLVRSCVYNVDARGFEKANDQQAIYIADDDHPAIILPMRAHCFYDRSNLLLITVFS